MLRKISTHTFRQVLLQQKHYPAIHRKEIDVYKRQAVQIAGITEDEFDALDETAQKEYLDAAIVKAYDTDNGITCLLYTSRCV